MSEGTKHDQGKYDPTYISQELIEQVARVRHWACTKKLPKPYERDNWKLGFKYTVSLGGALRHIFAFLKGEDLDSESGLPHLAHAIANLEHTLHDFLYRSENDNRTNRKAHD